jgi:hypothetical protein
MHPVLDAFRNAAAVGGANQDFAAAGLDAFAAWPVALRDHQRSRAFVLPGLIWINEGFLEPRMLTVRTGRTGAPLRAYPMTICS